MLKGVVKIIGIFVLTASLLGINSLAFAQTDGDPGTPSDASFEGRCEQMGKGNYALFPPCANSPSKCESVMKKKGDEEHWNYPLNCMFLEEPIGGEPGYDLYKVECFPNPKIHKSRVDCQYSLWHGEALTPPSDKKRTLRGPIQAILTFEEGKEYQGPFGLLYNYIGLIYKYLSGIIVGFVILMSIVGGIRMTTSAGNTEAFGAGRKMIIKALTGMVIWFLASLILYTINPTFFAF